MNRDGASRTQSPGLELSDQARDALRAAARASVRTERGGILVGYRDGLRIVVKDALVVTDETARRTTYMRRPGPAQRVLTEYMEDAASSSGRVVGYVGEWHTHPAPMPPSTVDRDSMRVMVRRNRDAVALVVAALHHDREVTFFALVSAVTGRLSRVRGAYVEAPVDHG